MSKKPFELPPGVMMARESYHDGAAFVFIDQNLQTIGRFIMTGKSQPQLSFHTEIAGDPRDPTTVAKWDLIHPCITTLREDIEEQRANGAF